MSRDHVHQDAHDHGNDHAQAVPHGHATDAYGHDHLGIGDPGGSTRRLGLALAVVVVVMAVVIFSYRQTVEAYPQGGGAYRVAPRWHNSSHVHCKDPDNLFRSNLNVTPEEGARSRPRCRESRADRYQLPHSEVRPRPASAHQRPWRRVLTVSI